MALGLKGRSATKASVSPREDSKKAEPPKVCPRGDNVKDAGEDETRDKDKEPLSPPQVDPQKEAAPDEPKIAKVETAALASSGKDAGVELGPKLKGIQAKEEDVDKTGDESDSNGNEVHENDDYPAQATPPEDNHSERASSAGKTSMEKVAGATAGESIESRMQRLQEKCASTVSELTHDLESVVTELLWTKEQLMQEREHNQQLTWQVSALKDDLQHINKELRKTMLSYQAALRDKSQEIDHNHELHVFLSKHSLGTVAQAESLLNDVLKEKGKALEDVQHLSNEVKIISEQRHQLQRENSDLRKESVQYKQQFLKQQMELALSIEERKRQDKRIISLQHQLQLFRGKTTSQAVATALKIAAVPEQHKTIARVHPIGGRPVHVPRPSNQRHALQRLHKKLKRLQRKSPSTLSGRFASR